MNSDVKAVLIETLTEIQKNNGYLSLYITGDTCPFTDLPIFDSLICVETSAMLSNKLGYHVRPETVFRSQSGERLTVDVISGRLENIQEKG